jgi:hypothetical protein
MRLTLALMLAFAPLAAAAQQPPAPPAQPDPIGALLDQIPDEPDEAAEAPPPRAAALPPKAASQLNDLALDSRIRASSASVQRFQGPLDGGWTLSAGAADLYALQLADRGNAPVEGAWRDLRRPGALDASGFIDEIERTDADLTLRFAGGRVAVLHGGGDGRWSGELTEGGQTRAVTLRRR